MLAVVDSGSVFVSHTSDMARYPRGRSLVEAAIDAILKVGLRPVDMSQFAAREEIPAEYCQRRVRECDVYLAVVGFRYGSRVAGRVDGISYTELEFLTATEAGIPRLIFLLGESVRLPQGLVDKDRSAVHGFRERLCSAGTIIKTVTSSFDLNAAVLHALYERRLHSLRSAGSTTEDAPGGVDRAMRDTQAAGQDANIYQALSSSELDSTSADEDEKSLRRRDALWQPPGGSTGLSAIALAKIESVRLAVDEALAVPAGREPLADHWEAAASEYSSAFWRVPAAQLVRDVGLDFCDLRRLLLHVQSPGVQRRLYRVAAHLAGVLACALSDLCHYRDARRWFCTTRVAAERAGDRRLQAWALAQDASEMIFHGMSAGLALQQAQSAQALAGASPSPALALALSARARAHAQRGERAETLAALDCARENFGKLDGAAMSRDVYGYDEQHLLFYEGDALTMLGDWRKAAVTHEQALIKYSDGEPLEPAFILLNGAKCLAQQGDHTEAARQAGKALLELPHVYLNSVVVGRAAEVADMIPARARGQSDLREIVETARIVNAP